MGDSALVKDNNATFLFLSNVIKEGTSFRYQRWTPTTLRATIPPSSDTADKAITITHEIPFIRDDSSDVKFDNNSTFVKKIFPFVDLLIQSGQPLLDHRWMRWFINLSLTGGRDGTFCDDLEDDSTAQSTPLTTTFNPTPQLVLKKYLNISVIDSSLIPLSLPSIRANMATLAKYSRAVNFCIVIDDGAGGGVNGDAGVNDTTEMDYIFDHTYNNNTTATTSTTTTIKPTIKLGVHFEKEEILKKINNVL